MSINIQSVWDATAGSAVTYDLSTGLVPITVFYYESVDCSGQAYVQNAMINTAVRDMNNNMFKVVGPVTSVQFNSIGNYGGEACQTGNPGQLVTSGTASMAQLTTYPNSAMPVQITLPASVVMASGQ